MRIAKKMILLLCLLTVFAAFTTNPLAQAQSENAQESSKYTIDCSTFTPWLAQKGYSLQDISNLSRIEVIKLTLSLSGQNIDKSMNEIRHNLFGNSTGPVPIPRKTSAEPILNPASGEQTTADQMSTDVTLSPTSGQACLVVAVSDYPGTGNYPGTGDLYYIGGAYTGIMYNVNNAGYDYVKSLTNATATYQNIWQWLTWLCASYQNVDLYLLGHGGNWVFGYFYCPFDSIWNGAISDYGRLYYSNEVKSWAVHPYEYHSLRLGLGGFCRSAGFYGDFCNQPILPGHELSDTKTRVWMGSWDEMMDEYTEIFGIYWTYHWYVQDQNSLDAYNNAYDEAYYSRGGIGTYNYFYNTLGEQTITFPAVYYLYIASVDEWGFSLYNSEIYLDYNYVGNAYAYIQITPGWHHIDATNPVWDDMLGRDVFIVDGCIGSFYISGNTDHYIYYN